MCGASCFRFRLFYEAFHLNAIDGRFAVAIALEEDALAVGRKDGRHRERIAAAMLTKRELAAREAQQDQNVRRIAIAAGADEYRSVAIGAEMRELAGGRNRLVQVLVGGMLAD